MWLVLYVDVLSFFLIRWGFNNKWFYNAHARESFATCCVTDNISLWQHKHLEEE